MEPQQNPSVALIREFARTYLRLQRLFDNHLASKGMSLSRLRLLSFLESGPRRAADIGIHFGHAPRTITEAVDGLEADGLVKRLACPGDRRAKLINITPKGRKTLTASQPLYEDLLLQTVGALGQSAQISLRNVLKHLNALMTPFDGGDK